MMAEANKTKSRLFCDSKLAFQKLVKSGQVKNDIKVYTRSFVIENTQNINSVYLDEKISDSFRREFKSSIFSLEEEIREILDKNAVSLSHKIIFLQTYNQFQADLLDGIILDRVCEFSGQTLIALPLTGQPGLDHVTKPNWIDWLSTDENTSILEVRIPFHNERAPRGDVKMSLFDRLRLGGVEAIIWKLFKSNLIPSSFFRKINVGILGQTEIMKDYIAGCILDGCLPANLASPLMNPIATKRDFETADYLLKISSTPLLTRLAYLKSDKLKARARNIFRTRLAAELAIYQQHIHAWRDFLCAQPKLKYILSGYQKGAKSRAIADICEEHKVKLIGCQHGITRELLENVTERSIFFENSFCDVFVSSNSRSAALTKSLKRHNRKFESLICKPSKEFTRATVQNKPQFDALFISTTLYSGHKPNGVPPTTDKNLSEKDQELIDLVFSRTNKTIHYKPYPSIRQLDRDPVLASVRAHSNMKVVGAHEELRYMLSDYRMFITTRATSTVSWAVASGRPLVFIDHFCHARLSNTARKAFAEAFFFFDQNDQDFHQALAKFLNLPFAEIEAQWEEKSLYREQTLHEFFTANSAINLYEAFSSFCD